MDEKEAIAQLKRGDVRGLEILVRKYQLEAVRIAFPIVNDLGLAEEIVQEAFLRVYHHIEQYDETRSFRSWFLRIVVNDALKMVHQQSRFIALESEGKDQTGEEESTLTHDNHLSFEQQEFSSSSDEAQILQEVLGKLSPEHRTVLQLKYYLEMTDEEIADMVQVSPGTVKSRLHAAKLNIRSLLKRLNLFV